jgi:hypothetical protein
MRTSRNKMADADIRNRVLLFNKFSPKCKEVTYIKKDEITYQSCKLRNGDGCNFKMCPLKKFHPKKDGKVKHYKG